MWRNLASAAAIAAVVVAVAPSSGAMAQTGGFEDVPDGAFYSVPVSALAERGVFDGTCAIRTDGTVACWGANTDGGQATPPEGTFTSVSAGGGHTGAIATDETVACWGSTSAPSPQFYSCGKHPQTQLAVCLPNDVAPVMTFSAISAGWDYTCGINTDGHLVCWDLGNQAGNIVDALKHYIIDGDDNPIRSAPGGRPRQRGPSAPSPSGSPTRAGSPTAAPCCAGAAATTSVRPRRMRGPTRSPMPGWI